MTPRTAPIDTAWIFVRRVCVIESTSRATSFGMKRARPRIVSATISSATAIDMSSVGSKLLPYALCRTLSSQTPTSAPGTLPTASHFETPRSTVPLRRWRQPPSVFVTAP